MNYIYNYNFSTDDFVPSFSVTFPFQGGFSDPFAKYGRPEKATRDDKEALKTDVARVKCSITT